MPVYEYRCAQCTKDFEYEHRMSEKRTECIECGGALERLISRTSFAFKGGGWYKDLYASPKPGAATEGGSSSGSSSTSSTEASSGAASGSATAAPASGSSTSSTGSSSSSSSTSGSSAPAAS